MKKVVCPLCLGEKWIYEATKYQTCKSCNGDGCVRCRNKGYITPPTKYRNCKGEGYVYEKE